MRNVETLLNVLAPWYRFYEMPNFEPVATGGQVGKVEKIISLYDTSEELSSMIFDTDTQTLSTAFSIDAQNKLGKAELSKDGVLELTLSEKYLSNTKLEALIDIASKPSYKLKSVLTAKSDTEVSLDIEFNGKSFSEVISLGQEKLPSIFLSISAEVKALGGPISLSSISDSLAKRGGPQKLDSGLGVNSGLI
ncbi:MAG: hypothetical protein H8D23_28020 [Candidatus Brocadiales bacterium]|nr:hypothetical protein [Candidatus Brocadiales bacterium]